MTPREPRLDFEGLYRTPPQRGVSRSATEARRPPRSRRRDADRVPGCLQGDSARLQTGSAARVAACNRGERPAPPLPNDASSAARGAAQGESLPSAEPPWRAQTEEIRAALATLAENQRKVFLLRELGGFSYGEIASSARHLRAGRADAALPRAPEAARRARPSGSARLGGLIPVPHWLLGLADRVPAGFAVPRVAGLVAASVIAAGVGVTSDVSGAEPTSAADRTGPGSARRSRASPRSRGTVAAPPAKAVAPNVRAAVVATQSKRQPTSAAAAQHVRWERRFRQSLSSRAAARSRPPLSHRPRSWG